MNFSEKIASWFAYVFGPSVDIPVDTSTTGYKLPSLSDFGKKQDKYPSAIQNPDGLKMKTHGTYDKGYPEGLCLHFTDGYSAKGEEDAMNTLAGGINDGYAYFVNDRNGVIYQTYPISEWGYHCGVSSWPNLGSSLNNKIIGIESCGMGQVALRSDGSYGSKEVPSMKEYWTKDDVRAVKAPPYVNAGTYLKFSPAQERSLVEFILWLAVQSGMGEAFIDNVVGHDEIAPDRRDDPGGSLSMPASDFRKKLKELYKKIV